MSSQAVYCLSLQIQPNDNGKNTTNNCNNNNNKNEASATTSAAANTKKTIELLQMQQQQQQQQPQQQLHQSIQQPQQQLTNNIILLRGSRNENGQIIIQNKHDIISFINEQQKQQQHDKSTAATLATQLPTTTTIARKIQSGISVVATTAGNVSISKDAASVAAAPTTSNTILLQTPINASQLESVLLQSSAAASASSNMKKSSTSLHERSFLIKNSSRSLSTESNRLSNADNKGPFVLQTLKRLEKSQSILVIRNSSSSSANSASTSNFKANNNDLTNSSVPTTATVSTNTGTAPQGALAHNNNAATTSLSFTRNSKGHQQHTKLANIIAANRSTTASTASSVLSTSLSSLKSSSNGATTTTTTTFLRLGSNTTVAAAAAAFANKNKSGNKVNVAGAASNNYNNNNQRNNRNILNGATTASLVEQQQLGLADVQLKHERTTSSSAAGASVAVQQQQQTNVPLGTDGEPIKLPDNLESLPRADSFPSQRHRWNTNEEIAAILISFDKHNEWQSKEVRTRPKSGSLLLYSRKKVRYRRDGYCWKKRKDGKTTREDHMKLKVQGTECIYGCYVHSAILPTFHRRCYWLLQNPDIVLVHYLNVPYPDDNKMAVIAPSITLWGDKKEWTKEELVSQLKPMLSSVTSDDDSDSGNDIEISTAETVESIVCQLMEKQRLSRQAALVKQLDCGCADSNCTDGKSCSHPVMRRTGLLKSVSEKRANLSDSYNHAATTTPNVVIGPKLYARWPDRRTRDTNMDNHHYQQQQQHHQQHQQLPQEAAIKFQIIQPQHNEQQQHHTSYQQQQHYRQHNHVNSNNNNNSHVTPHHQLLVNRNNLIIQHQQQQQPHQQQNFNQATTAPATMSTNNQNNQINLQRFVANHNNNNNNSQIINNNRLQIAKTTITATTVEAASASVTNTDVVEVVSELIGNQNHISTNSNNSTTNKINRSSSNQLIAATQQQLQQAQQNSNDANAINNNTSSNNNNNYAYNTSMLQQQEAYKMQQQQQQQTQATTNAQREQEVTTSSTSSVQPMCMSPEHQPSTPVHGSSSSNNNNPLLFTGSQNNIMQTSCSPSSANSSPAAATTSSSCHSAASPIVDESVVNQNQSSSLLSPATSVTTTVKTENLFFSNENQHTSNDVGSNDFAATTEMSTSSGNSSGCNVDLQHQHSNISSNSNNKEYNNSNNTNTLNGCHPLSASQENSNSTTEEIEATTNQDLDNSSHVPNTIDFETMDTNIVDTATATVGNSNEHDLHGTLGFFNETLDLSQEDIQRTLIANLPFDTVAQSIKHSNVNTDSSLVNPLEFMTNNCAENNNAGNAISLTSGTSDHDDETNDVFVNLDAFDMLVEFPDLDLDDKQALSHASLEHTGVQIQQLQHNDNTAMAGHLAAYSYDSIEKSSHCSKKLLNICDFSPEWSYPEGGVKVLVAGPWTNANNTYTVLFDSLPVPTLLVQEGVLRCYCPAHEVGFATLQVSCDGYVISNSVMFEYKLTPCPEAPFDVTSSDCLYKFTLLNRLSSIDEKMQIKTELTEQQNLFSQANFEEKLVSYCQQLMKGTWRANLSSSWTSGYKDMSLLHLSAALGYSKLVCAMLNWRTENPNFILETEIDALSQDIHGYTPMAWACARGHIETALILYKWNQNALKIKNYNQQTPLEIANAKGHKTLIAEVYRLEYERNKKCNKSSLSSLSLNLNKYTLTDKRHPKTAHHSSDDLYNDKLCENLMRSHDGVFLRPVPVASSNQSPPNYSRFSKRSSVDSGINMDMRTKPGKSLKDLSRLQGFDVHENFSLSALDSPLDSFNTTNATNSLLSPLRKMDFALCEVSTGDSSPLPDKEHDDDSSTLNNDDISDVVLNSETDGVVGDSDAKVLTLAEHIIAAMPERIKNEADEMMVLGSPMTDTLNSESSGLNDSFMDPLLDSLPNTHFDSDFSLDFNEHSYRYHDVSTPCSSLSPASSGPLQSPASYSLLGVDPSVNSPSPPPSTKQLTEFLHASSKSQCPFEADFSRLTLTDSEQRELYEAAKCIQKAYRSYKGRQKLEEQNKERSAAIVIQNYYRRYKQYAYYRQMTSAALVIQHGYRSYCRHKRFKKSKQGSSGSHNSNSQCLSSFYDHYKNDQQQQQDMLGSQPSTPKETSPSGPLKRTYSQSTQNQAARKIQQFMRQSRIKLQKERAEKEKLVHQRRAEYLQSLQYQDPLETVCKQEASECQQLQL